MHPINKGNLLYQFVITVMKCFFKIVYRHKVYGLENYFPGGALICSNHVSYYDPPLLAISWPEELHFLARETLFSIPLFGKFIYALNARPVRGTPKDISTFRIICTLLKEEKKMILFPEGSRSFDGELGPLKPGSSFFIMRTKKAIVPAYIQGTYAIWNRKRKFPKLWGRTYCIFGKPISYEEFASLHKHDAEVAISTRLREKILALKTWFENGAEGTPP